MAKLTWTAPPDGGSPITSYRVLVFEGANPIATLTSTTTTCVIPTGDVERTALIQAINSQGHSAPLQVNIPAVVFTGDVGAPTYAVRSLDGCGIVTVADPGEGNFLYTECYVLASDDDVGEIRDTAAIFPYLVFSRPNDVPTRLRFVSATADGRRLTSPYVTFTPTAVGTPKTPTLAIDTTGTDRFVITQQDPGVEVDSLTLAVVAFDNSAFPDDYQLFDPVTLPATVTGLTAGRQYDIFIASSITVEGQLMRVHYRDYYAVVGQPGVSEQPIT